MATPKTPITELDFDSIKSQLKTYLQTQTQFKDYNFEGSGLNVLLDLLAYNTYYNSFYLNMVAAEAFLPTAQKRNSVVNLAKSLNYTPRSVTSASISGTATLTVTGAPTSVTIPAYTSFTGTVDGKAFNFLNTSSVIITQLAGVYSATMSLKEGRYINRRYSVNLNDSDQRFLIPNKTGTLHFYEIFRTNQFRRYILCQLPQRISHFYFFPFYKA